MLYMLYWLFIHGIYKISQKKTLYHAEIIQLV